MHTRIPSVQRREPLPTPTPEITPNSFLPDDFMLGAQGVQFDSFNPFPLTDEGSLDRTQDNQYRLVRVRRPSPEGTIERTILMVDAGGHAHITLGEGLSVDVHDDGRSVAFDLHAHVVTGEPVHIDTVKLNPESESDIEQLSESAALPPPEASMDEAIAASHEDGDVLYTSPTDNLYIGTIITNPTELPEGDTPVDADRTIDQLESLFDRQGV